MNQQAVIVNTLLIIGLLCIASSAFAQQERKYIRAGNELYKEKNYDQAQESYQKALEQNMQSNEAAYNLGAALYRREKFTEAAGQWEQAMPQAPQAQAEVYHNIGNSLLSQKEYEKSIEAYKEALRRNPKDEDTRYNLAYAQQLLKEQQNQQNQDQQQDQQNEQEQKQDKNKQDQQNQQQNRQQQISKEDAERLLDALANQEQEVQEKKDEKKQAAAVRSREKDW